MGDIWADWPCAKCGDFYDAHTCNTEEELSAYQEKHKDEIHFCEGCSTFTKHGSGEEVKVVFTTYGTERGMRGLLQTLRKYMENQ